MARPVIYHGMPAGDEDSRIVGAVLEDIGTRLSAVPSHLGLRVICSVLLSSVCAQDDPMAAFRTIIENVELEIKIAIAEPKGAA